MSDMAGGVRLWFQSAVELDEAGPYAAALEQRAVAAAAPGTTVAVRGVAPGTWAGQQPSALFGIPAVFLAVLGPAFLRAALRAERDGYDAFVIGTFIEPFLRELRSAVGIPVLSSLEASLLAGCAAAGRIGLVTINGALLQSLRDSIARHGLEARVCAVRTLTPEVDEAGAIALLADPARGLDAFTAAARQVVAAGADAVLPAETILATLTAQHALREVDGAAVLDPTAIAVRFAEMRVALHRGGGLRTGRRWHAPAAPPGLLRQILGS